MSKITKIFVNQITEPKQAAGMIRTEHLGMWNQAEPVYIRNRQIDRIYEYIAGSENLASFVEKLPKMTIPAEGKYRWKLRGSSEIYATLVKATIDEAGNTNVTDVHKAGRNGAVFYMWFSENIFTATSTLGSKHPEQFMVRCVSDGIQIGTMFRYPVQLLTGDPTLWIPASELQSGSKWRDEFGLVEPTLSIRGNTMTFATSFDMENTTSVLRKNQDIPGNMIENMPLKFDFVTDDGTTFSRWIPYQDWEFNNQFRRDKARLILNGKNTVLSNGGSNIKGESGNSVIAGYGLYEQMNNGNSQTYNKFSIKALTNFITEITYNKVPEDKRKIVMSTGTYGMAQFHEAIVSIAGSSAYSYLHSDRNFAGNTFTEGQFTTYEGLNGIEITVVLDPMKDIAGSGQLMHPDGGPVSSYNYDIFDFGTTNGEPNIQRVCVEGNEEFYAYTAGMRDPFQPYNNLSTPRAVSSFKDGYSIAKQWIGGVAVINPLKTGRFLHALYVA